MTETVFDRIARGSVELVVRLMERMNDALGPEENYGSPLEFGFAVALACAATAHLDRLEFIPSFGLDAKDVKKHPATVGYIGAIFPQVAIGPYRVDFLVHCPDAIAAGLVVECDGHDFHEKTKEQAARDKARDRFLTQMGFRILRFTGSEVWKAPIPCALEVMQMASDMHFEKFYDAYLRSRKDNEDEAAE